MISQFKYLPISDRDKSWGLYVVNAGASQIPPDMQYPPAGHPAKHHFSWERGRILNEYQLIYISQGKGIFESKHVKSVTIEAGTIILLFPSEWHRFKPYPNTGWHEFWVGFDGTIAQDLVSKNFFSIKHPVLNLGFHAELLDLFRAIASTVDLELPGYQQLASGMTFHLLGLVTELLQKQRVKHANISSYQIEKALTLLRKSVDSDISMEVIASEVNLGYSKFRKDFKMHTGMAPHQYLMQLKLDHAKTLLSSTNTAIKEISSKLGFQSEFHFSKLFKNKTGKSPLKYRQSLYMKQL
ncbi:AraC family transcriptional regulator [Mucilaginibacter yixingensis]|uniref:AraC family transcriptional regulator n=1 Tax=Mucilaginibacter yixingensis TaxID=1295612 RepID=A0A2T5J949_9SPHI|nr:AraC family transcriptional regulator [Mucilaginibacter yixingensis]PTQ96587.1 AraC family transcriptional regulator [Mucilaginibacter yixingensis]